MSAAISRMEEMPSTTFKKSGITAYCHHRGGDGAEVTLEYDSLASIGGDLDRLVLRDIVRWAEARIRRSQWSEIPS